MNMEKKNLIAFGIGTLILAYVIYTLEPGKIIDVLLNIRLEYFLLAGLFYFLNEVMAALSLRILTSSRVSLIELIISHMCGMFYSNATPGRIGYYYTSLSIAKKTKTSRRGNIGLLTLFQGINFFIKVFLCIIAVIYFSTYLIDRESQNYLLLVSVLPLIGVILLAITFYTNILNNILSKLPLIKNFIEYIEGMQQAVREVGKRDILKLIALGLFGWIFMSTQWFLLAKSMGLDISYLTALMLQPLLTTVMFVPISPSGLGFTEFGSVLLFKAVGYIPEVGVAFMLLVRANSLIIDSFGVIDMKIHGRN
jgi:uncharacterized protein (TIRG00374 family)